MLSTFLLLWFFFPPSPWKKTFFPWKIFLFFNVLGVLPPKHSIRNPPPYPLQIILFKRTFTFVTKSLVLNLNPLFLNTNSRTNPTYYIPPKRLQDSVLLYKISRNEFGLYFENVKKYHDLFQQKQKNLKFGLGSPIFYIFQNIMILSQFFSSSFKTEGTSIMISIL